MTLLFVCSRFEILSQPIRWWIFIQSLADHKRLSVSFFESTSLRFWRKTTFFSFLASRLYLVSVDCVHSEKTPLRGVDDENKPSDGDDKAEVAEQTSLTIIK